MKSPRTALIITPYFPPDGGGLERYAKQIATRLNREHGWRVVMVAAAGAPGTPDSKRTVDGVTVYQLGYRLRLSNTPFGLRWRRKLRHIIATEQPAIINAHMPVPGLADVAASVAGRIPFVLTYHTGSMKKGRLLPDLFVGAYERFQLPRLLRRADSIVCSSTFVRDDFLGSWAYKSTTITPGADETLFKPRRRSSLTQPEPTILFVGSFGPSYRHKGLADAIGALSELKPHYPNITLKVIGEGDTEHYKAQMRKLDVVAHVEFLGTLEPAQIAALCSEASLLVLPSSNDSFPMVIVEAMAAGLPVVSTNIGGIPTVISSGINGLLVEPHDVPALAQAIGRILADPDLAAKLGRAGRRKVLAGLTWSQKAAGTHELFEQVLAPHICQVTAYYPPHIGGIENVVRELSHMLVSKGFGVDVITSKPHGRRPAPSEPEGLRVTRLPSADFLHTPVMRGLFRALIRQPRRTIVHLHVAQAIVPEVTWLAAKLRRLPLVTHFHLDVEPSSPVGHLIFRPYKRLFLRFVLRHSDRVIFLSHEQRATMVRKYGLNPSSTYVMPNGVSDEYFQPTRERFHSPLRLLFVGRLAVQKRPERIVEAMAKLPQAHLDVVGEGEDRRSLAHLAAKHNLTNITFHGAKVGAELRQLYRDADVFVLPSDREGMPLVLLEAMASSLPVVGSDVPGIRELVAGNGLLVKDPSAATFAGTLAELPSNPDRLVKLSAASRATAEEYSWSRLTRGLQTLYQELASW